MTRSRPIDRCCPLIHRGGNSWRCLREINGNESIPLLMGCPEHCTSRDLILENDNVRANYERCRKWEDAT